MDATSECEFRIRFIAKKIEHVLQSTKISKRKFAKKSLLGEATIRSLLSEASNIELGTMTKLRLVFGITLSELIDDKVGRAKLKIAEIDIDTFELNFLSDKIEIGKRISLIQKTRQIDTQHLSLLSYNLDYSDTIKYLKGEKNFTLLTIIKYSHGLEIPVRSIFDFKGPMPTNVFKGNMK